MVRTILIKLTLRLLSFLQPKLTLWENDLDGMSEVSIPTQVKLIDLSFENGSIAYTYEIYRHKRASL